MSTLKSSAEDLTLNADGSGNDVIIQSDGSTKAIITAEGNVGIGLTPSGAKLHISNTNAGSQERGLYVDVSPEAGTSPNNLAMFMAGNGNITTPLVRIHHESPAANQLLLQCDTTSSNSVKFSVDEDGDVKLDGNVVIATAGKGIDFSAATDAGGMTSELLDDYEEGTFTPALWGNSTAGNTAYASQVGFYEKIGRTVHIRGSIEVSSKGTIDGLVFVTGLPFTANATTNRSCIHLGYADHFSITASESISGTVMGNDTTFLLRVWGDTGGTVNMDDARLSDSSDFYFSGTYYV